MRRLALLTASTLALLLISTPSYAFFHNAVHNAALHTVLDVLTVAVVSAPLWTVYLWAGRRRGLLAALVCVVQVPVAIIGFVPIIDPALHVVLGVTALALTGGALGWVRTVTRPATEPQPAPR